MADNSAIEWTDASWNPVRGCSRVSEGCRNCYAERVSARFSGPGQPFEGLAVMTENGPRWTREIRLLPEKLDLPLSWTKPRRIFVNSMSDLFHEDVPFQFVVSVFVTMALAGRHTFQVLTKRPERMATLLNDPEFRQDVENEIAVRFDGVHREIRWPLPNVWLGTSVEDQASADERIPHLLRTPAGVRFLSCEPLLGPVNLTRYLLAHHLEGMHACVGVHWVIVGGESGPGARAMDLSWARGLVRECRQAGVAVFVKQLGRWVLGDHAGFRVVNHWLLRDGYAFVPPVIGAAARQRPENAIGFSLFDAKGGNMDEWPEDLRVREFPVVRS